jgi:hypothetical protein
MPLLKGKQNVGRNIKELIAANKSKKKKRNRKQIIAIAMNAAGVSKKSNNWYK